ncbi:MAG: M48 family metalloprotease [Proteobacteria bacterium]|nr:M48 family metalloprotease [Pseudomonadota bacterium]
MPGLRAAAWRGSAPVLALGLLAWAPAPAQAFLHSLNPFADTKDEFEGRFIDTIEPEPWKPPLERLAAERAAADNRAGTRRPGVGRLGEDDDDDESTVRAEPPPPPDPIPDGLTLLRITEDSVASAPGWEGYLNDVGARLLAGAPITGAPVRFYVTASEDYGAAKAFPDGAVGIPWGLLRQVDSEDELAFILGHEASHVLLGHHDNDWFQSMNQNLVSAAEMALSLGVALSEKLGQGGLAQDAAKIGLIAAGALFVVDKGLFPSFTREQEDEADLLGLDLMIGAGYNSQGAFDAFAKLQVWEATVAARPSAQAQQRSKLETEIGQSANRGNFDAAVQGVLKMFSLAVEEVADTISVGHRSAVAREESLLDYFFREYAEDIPPDSSAARLEAVRNDAEGQELFGSYRNAWDAIDIVKADDGRLAEAEKLARLAVSGRFKNDSLARYAFFRTRLQQGNIGKAQKNLELALEGPRPSLVIYRDLAEIHWAQGRRAEAMELLESAFEEFQQPPELYTDLVYRHYLLGDRKKAEQMAIKCKFRNRQAGKVCGKAAKGENPRPAR